MFREQMRLLSGDVIPMVEHGDEVVATAMVDGIADRCSAPDALVEVVEIV
jgi:hypothetical protein